jgi:hypothetical protein
MALECEERLPFEGNQRVYVDVIVAADFDFQTFW